MDKQLFNASLLNAIGKRLIASEKSIAIAESVTSRLLQFAFSSIKDAEKFYQGGLTVYNIGQKIKHLHIDPIVGVACNCVSQQIADEMALHVISHFNSDWGIAITGYATAVPESGEKIFAYYSIAAEDRIQASGKMEAVKTMPPAPQIGYVNTIMEIFAPLAGNDKIIR